MTLLRSRTRPGRRIGLVAAVVLAAFVTGSAAGTISPTRASAEGSSGIPFSDPGVKGALTFQQPDANPLSTGPIEADPTFAKGVGDRPSRGGDTLAKLQACTPVSGSAPSGWNCALLNDQSSYASGANPVSTGMAGAGETLGTFIGVDGGRNGADPASPYAGLYQIRLTTAAAGGSSDGSYYAAVVKVTEGQPTAGGTATGSWQFVPGGGQVVTRTTITASPGDAVQQTGSAITLTATVRPTGVDGTITYYDGGTAIGTGPSVTLKPADGDHTFTAAFAPADSAGYKASTSGVVGIYLGHVVQSCSAISASPQGAVRHGTVVTLTATAWTAPDGGSCQSAARGAAAPGKLEFDESLGGHFRFLGNGSGYTPSSGTATLSLGSPPDGTHAYVARFLPDDQRSYVIAVSRPETVVEGQVLLALSGNPPSPVAAGGTVQLTAHISPAVPGTLRFFTRPAGQGGGGTDIGTADSFDALMGEGKRVVQLPPAPGSLAYGATFVPEDAAGFTVLTDTPSAPNPITYQFLRVAPATSITADPPGSSTAGTTVVATATVAPAGAPGFVEFFDASEDVGGADSYDAATGVGLKRLSLAPGPHILSAQFVPADQTQFSSSFSNGLSYVVLAPVLPVAPAVAMVSTLSARPVVLTRPTLAGTARVGKTGACRTGGWQGQPSFQFQWLRSGWPIGRATRSTYVFTAADLGRLLSCRVTATDSAGSMTATTLGETIRLGDAPRLAHVAAVVGSGRVVGGRLATTSLRWTVGGVAVRYQWLRDGRAIPGARRTSYVLTVHDVGHVVSVLVHAAAPGRAVAVVTVQRTDRR